MNLSLRHSGMTTGGEEGRSGASRDAFPSGAWERQNPRRIFSRCANIFLRRENNDTIRIRVFPKPTQTKTDPDKNLPRPKPAQTP